MSQCDGTGDAPHFPSELEVVAAWGDAVGVADGDDRQAEQEGDQDDEEDGVGPGRAAELVFNCRRVRLLATLHEQRLAHDILQCCLCGAAKRRQECSPGRKPWVRIGP